MDSSGNKGHVETYFDSLYRAVKTRTNDPKGAFASTVEYDGLGRTVCTRVSTATTSPCASGARPIHQEPFNFRIRLWSVILPMRSLEGRTKDHEVGSVSTRCVSHGGAPHQSG